jgi:hypothetical protein
MRKRKATHAMQKGEAALFAKKQKELRRLV